MSYLESQQKRNGQVSLIFLILSQGQLISFPNFKGKGLKNVIPNLNEKQENLLNKMLCMDPLTRQSSYEILNNKIFEGKTKQLKAHVEIFDNDL